MSSFAKDWIAGASAGCIESVLTMPFEVLKTRLQVQPQLTWKSFFLDSHAPKFAGLQPILLQTSMKIGLRYSSFEAFKLYTNPVAAGFFAGAFEALVWITPTERLKVLFITSSQRHHQLGSSVKLLISQNGFFKGLWRGGTATVMRNSCTVGTRFAIFERISALVSANPSSPSMMENAFAGFFSGGITTALFQPIDVVKTRMSADESNRYRGNVDCFRQIFREQGFKGFLSGLTARMVKISLGQAIVFSVYGRIRSLL